MRLLFEIDTKDYEAGGSVCIRPSVRGIIVQEGLLAMVHSRTYDYYKFPGGGIEQQESQIETLCREVREETGLTVLPDSARPFGRVHRVQKGDPEDMFIQDNYYYFCDAVRGTAAQSLDAYEAEEGFTLRFVSAQTAVTVNETHPHGCKDGNAQFAVMLARECRVLRMLSAEFPALLR